MFSVSIMPEKSPNLTSECYSKTHANSTCLNKAQKNERTITQDNESKLDKFDQSTKNDDGINMKASGTTID